MRDLDRIIVIRPRKKSGAPSYLEAVFESAKRLIPRSLSDWDERVGEWCDQYRNSHEPSRIIEIKLERYVYLFDMVAERVTLCYGCSAKQSNHRDETRMRRFPDVNVGIRKMLGINAFPADRGHLMGHSAGGGLDINLFPQARSLNRGWSTEGRIFRRMERFASANPGVFFYHRLMYNDDSWIPAEMEYGVLKGDVEWWVELFHNR